MPRQKSLKKFQDQIRTLTRRKTPRKLRELSERSNPVLGGGGTCSRNAKVRALVRRLDGGIERRLSSFRAKRWRHRMGCRYPSPRLINAYSLVRLPHRISSLKLR